MEPSPERFPKMQTVKMWRMSAALITAARQQVRAVGLVQHRAAWEADRIVAVLGYKALVRLAVFLPAP